MSFGRSAREMRTKLFLEHGQRRRLGAPELTEFFRFLSPSVPIHRCPAITTRRCNAETLAKRIARNRIKSDTPSENLRLVLSTGIFWLWVTSQSAKGGRFCEPQVFMILTCLTFQGGT